MILPRDDAALPPDVNLGPGLIASIWVEMAVCTLILMARFYTRSRIVKKIAPDDWMMLVASVMGGASNILYTISVSYGTGRHQVYLTAFAASQAFKFNIISQVIGIFSITLARISFAMLLLGILPRHERGLRSFIWSIIGFQLVINLVMIIYILAQCQPVARLWDYSVPGTCLSPAIQTYIGFAQGTINSISDLALAILPSMVIWNLNMKRAVKVSLCISMGLGVFAMIASIVKTVYIQTLADLDDYSYKTSYLLIWLSLEHHLIMISASIPTLRPLISNRERSRFSYGSKGTNISTIPDTPNLVDRRDPMSKGPLLIQQEKQFGEWSDDVEGAPFKDEAVRGEDSHSGVVESVDSKSAMGGIMKTVQLEVRAHELE